MPLDADGLGNVPRTASHPQSWPRPWDDQIGRRRFEEMTPVLNPAK